jgi:protein-S-isoprenylcysteine O-methyltransferase Ste14
MGDGNKDCPNVIALPPLVFGAVLGIGLLVHWFWPIPIGNLQPPRWIGGGLAASSAVLAIWGERAMRRAGTNIKPTEPTTAIVQDGPFRFSRNPLYLSLTILYVGVALMFNALIPLLLLSPLLVVVHFGIVRREERYLEAKFGSEYTDYCKRVRRWI